MKLILYAWADSESMYGPEFAVLDIDGSLACDLLERIALAQKIRTADIYLASIEYHLDHLDWYSRPDLDEDYAWLDDLRDGLMRGDAKGEPTGMDCVRLCVDADDVWWRGRVKHADIEVCTATIDRTILEQIAGRPRTKDRFVALSDLPIWSEQREEAAL